VTQAAQAWRNGEQNFTNSTIAVHNGAGYRSSRKQGLQMLHIPPRSPDFSPIESFWDWLRREIRQRDLEDVRLGCQPNAPTHYYLDGIMTGQSLSNW
jgi:hypothetical protein